MMEDKLLIWRCKRGSREALRQIYEKYHVDLLKLAVALTGEANTAQDVVHDVFVKFAESVRRISVTGSLKGYLVTSTVNRTRSLWRAQRRHGEQSLDETADPPSHAPPPEQWAILSEQLERLRLALAQLPEEQREVVALLVEGWDSERSWTEAGSLELRPTRIWAVANTDQTMIEKYRFELDGVTLLTTDGHKTWKYEPQAHRVTIKSRPYVASECWLGSGLLEQLKQLRDAGTITQWQERSGKDPATGKAVVVLDVAWLDGRWNGPRSVRLEFDLESKLLVSMKQWENANWEGPASFIAEKITYYESLPDDLFEFQIPPGATVVEQ